MIKHLAIIMDGNGRWGMNHYSNRNKGHKRGVEVLDEILPIVFENGIKILTVYAFSTENWKRSKVEVNALMKLFHKYLDEKTPELKRKNIRLCISGSTNNLSETLKNKILEINQEFLCVDGPILNICFNYGGRLEIVETVNKLIASGYDKITENDITNNLYNNIPEPDLIIRTGGDIRISNFLIWQLAYSEMYFTNTLWPDFNKEELKKAIGQFNKRDRRYGGINAK